MEIDLTKDKKELDELSEQYLSSFESFLNTLDPKNYKIEIFVSRVWDENETYISKVYDHIYTSYPQSEPNFLSGIFIPNQDLVSRLAMLSYVAQIRMKFDNLQQKYLLAVLPNVPPS